jgi:tRNA(fMet)-specific endonuclease VapC
MKFMLDTNVCIALIKRKDLSVLGRLQAERPGDVCVSSITLAEMEYGAHKSAKTEQNRLALAAFFAAIPVMPFDDAAAQEYGRIRAHLERRGTPIGSLDGLIAAHALALRCVLVTNNEAEFRRVPGLRVENWTKP